MSLTVKQEAFCLAYMETGNASEAYRQSYSIENMGENSIRAEAGKMMANPTISLRIEELQEEAKQRNAITVESLIKELEEARDAALKADNPQSSAAVAATMGKAKLLGMLTDKLDASLTTKSLPASVDDFV
jgi:phage terminase small subunit